MNNNTTIPNNNQPNTIVNSTPIPQQSPKETQTSSKKTAKKFLIFLIILGILMISLATYLLIDDNNKYNNYTIIAADLLRQETVNEKGITYKRGIYKYIVNKKEYFYTSQKLTTTTPEKITQVKYNPEDPNKIYNEKLSSYYFILLFSGIALSFISIIILISLSKSKLQEIITVQVIEQVTCVGGRRIYLDNIKIPNTDPNAIATKYYVYFSNDLNKFAIGNKLQLNIYKYNEVLTTEKYNNISARTLYDFKDEDFTLIEQVAKQEINKY